MADQCSGGGPGGYPGDCEITRGLLERANKRQEPPPRSKAWQEALPRARRIKMLLLDVDGVLTDGTITYTHGGGESKGFNTQDGFGLRILQDGGVEVGIITARVSEAVTRRAEDLKLTHVYQGSRNKIEAFTRIMERTGFTAEEIAYMGDDWLDLPLLCRVGFALAPANAVFEVQQRAHYVTSGSGGRGAVREVCDLILESKGRLAELLNKYTTLS